MVLYSPWALKTDPMTLVAGRSLSNSGDGRAGHHGRKTLFTSATVVEKASTSRSLHWPRILVLCHR